jgi:hypothetical protein
VPVEPSAVPADALQGRRSALGYAPLLSITIALVAALKMSLDAENYASCRLWECGESGLEAEISELVEAAALELFGAALFEVAGT